MADPSIIKEITEIRRTLSLLQSRLLKLESAISLTPPKLTDAQSKPSSISDKSSKKNEPVLLSSSVPDSASKRSSQTLRSRSFQVMRHLINLVDVSQADVSSGTTKTARIPKSSPPPARSEQSVTSTPKQVAGCRSPDSVTSRPPTSGVNELPKAKSLQPDTPRVFHPKRPRKNAEALSSPIASALHPPLPRKDANMLSHSTLSASLSKSLCKEEAKLASNLSCIKTATTKTNTTAPRVSTSTKKSPIKEGNKVKDTTNVFQSDRLQRNSDRFDLLKLDAAFSDLLPSSGSDYVCFKTKYWTPINNLPQASSSLIQQQILGVWEWKEGTPTAKLYEYRVPTSETTIDRRRFKYIGWAWRGKKDQQPPRVQDLPEDIHQGCDTLRWYWFKDLWLLFYFLLI